jgi:hypothetical protein
VSILLQACKVCVFEHMAFLKLLSIYIHVFKNVFRTTADTYILKYLQPLCSLQKFFQFPVLQMIWAYVSLHCGSGAIVQMHVPMIYFCLNVSRQRGGHTCRQLVLTDVSTRWIHPNINLWNCFQDMDFHLHVCVCGRIIGTFCHGELHCCSLFYMKFKQVGMVKTSFQAVILF